MNGHLVFWSARGFATTLAAACCLAALGGCADVARTRSAVEKSAGISSAISLVKIHELQIQLLVPNRCIVRTSEDGRMATIFDASQNTPVMDLQVFPGVLDKVNASEQIFVRDSGVMVFAASRFSRPEADSVRGDGWAGFSASFACASDDEFGAHAAGSDCQTAMISDGKRTILIESRGEQWVPREVFNLMLRSIRFYAR